MCFSPFTIHGKYLPQATIDPLIYPKEWLHCVIACQKLQGCLAYNYNLAKKFCELKSEGIAQRDDEAGQLLENPNYIYHQMKVCILFLLTSNNVVWVKGFNTISLNEHRLGVI